MINGAAVILGMRQTGMSYGNDQSGEANLVTNRYLCVQRSRTLRALNPSDGQTLWERQDVPLNSTIFGDDEYVFVLPPDKAEAMVLSGVGRRTAGYTEDRTPRNQGAAAGRHAIHHVYAA